MESLSSGGGERSLLTLLELLDYDRYEVDLLLFYKGGLFFDMLPEQVNVIDFGEKFKRFSLPVVESVKSFVCKGNFSLAFNRLMFAKTVNSSSGSSLLRDQQAWKYMKKCFEDKNFEYDAAIGYLEGKSNFFVADCVEAKTKIGYIHSDYDKLKMDREVDRKIFSNLDYVVGVSDKCVGILRENFPEMKEKFRAIENITSPSMLKKMAESSPVEFVGLKETAILTVGRISQPKGYDIAVDAASILDENGVDFKWFAIGVGEMSAQIEQKIKEKKLEDKFILLGERANPYPYINGCDIYVQPSYYEGKSIAIDEAKCFAKPIVTTKFTTVFDQLEDEKTALLAEIDASSVAEKIIRLINNKELQQTLSRNLSLQKQGNEEELQKFYELLGE